jgi:uncharacterized protein (DUF1800 family)
MNTNHLIHLYKRAAFGLLPKEVYKLQSLPKKKILQQLFEESSKSSSIKVVAIETFSKYRNFKQLSQEEKRAYQKLNREKIQDLNHQWMNQLFNTKQPLRERMTLFWSNHFVAKDNNALHFQSYNNLLRKYALGNFRDFVIAVAKSATMLKYLNTKQNRKQQPNENFARELMELFTLGIGNYSEQDIKEAARAFTGWNHTTKGDFSFRNKAHDHGKKTFLGKTENFTGEAIINHILSHKQCARFICTKIYSYFVNTEINTRHIDEMTDVFFENYNIKKLMLFMLSSKWFYEPVNQGTKIKSPVDLLVDINKIVPLNFERTKQLIYLQKRMGQELLNPVNVAGWKMGQHWIDTNSLMFRLKLPAILLNNSVISLSGFAEFEDTYEMYAEKRKNRKTFLKVNKNWEQFNKNFGDLNADNCRNLLISSELSQEAKILLERIDYNNPKDYCLQLMSLPEFQLC